MSAPRRAPMSCRCGTAVSAAEHGVCAACDRRATIFVLVLAGHLRPTHLRAAELLVRMVSGHVDGHAVERARRQRSEEARAA